MKSPDFYINEDTKGEEKFMKAIMVMYDSLNRKCWNHTAATGLKHRILKDLQKNVYSLNSAM